MFAPNPLARWIVSRTVSRGLSGRPRDLHRLLRLARTFDVGETAHHFFDSLDYSLDRGEPFAELFLRLGRELSPQYRRKIAANLMYNEYIAGAIRRRQIAHDDVVVPSFFVVSPTMRCNLACPGCYSGLYPKDEELSFAELERLFTEARELGIYFVTISGGEPWTRADELLALLRKFPDMFFLTYTNGTLLDDAVCRELGRLGTVAPCISVEGFAEQTDERRGPGVHARVIAAMRRLRENGVMFGFSATATSRNVDVISSDEFARYYIEQGCMVGWYFLMMPVGADRSLELAPSADQRMELGRRVAALRERYPIFLADFWNDGPAAGGCLAGGRFYLHILNTGDVEACVFAHFGVDNIRGKSLLEVANSPFFKDIRAAFPYNDTGNLRRPCMIIDNPEVLRGLVAKHHAAPGDRDGDAILTDPVVRAWVDSYAKRMEELAEPAWEKVISNPDSRWWREGPEYRNFLNPPVVRREKQKQAAKDSG